MLKYKNRLTPNIYTLQKLLIFYKKKKTSYLFPLNNFSAISFIQNFKRQNLSFNSIFSTLHFCSQEKWINIDFKVFSNPLVSQKYFSNTLKLPLFLKQGKLTLNYSSKNYFKSYTDLYTTSCPLIGKPFNFLNPYFFVPKNFDQEKTFKLKPYFTRVIWKSYFLKTLKDRFTFNTNKVAHSQSRFKLLTGNSFGGPIPSTNTLFKKPYLFTNSSEKKPILKHFCLSIIKNPFLFYKNTQKKFIKRRFSWSKVSLMGYKRRMSKYFLLTSFNLISDAQSQKVKKHGKNLLSRLNQQLLSPDFKTRKFSSTSLFITTVKLLRKSKRLRKSIKALNNSFIKTISKQFQNNLLKPKLKPIFNKNPLFFTPVRVRKTTPFKYRLQKLALKRKNNLFKRKRSLRFKFWKKSIKYSLKLLTPQLLNTFLLRPGRWGRKFLRRAVLRKSINLTTFNLTLLKLTYFLKNQSRLVSKTNYSLIRKKFLWRKFLKWRKVKKLKNLSVKQKLIFNKFFSKYAKKNFLVPVRLKKLRFRARILKKIVKRLKKTSVLPYLFSKNFLFKTNTTHYFNPKSSSLYPAPVSLVSSYGLSFIFPLYGFLFITSSNLSKDQLTTKQTLIKKTIHSFFFLDDLKSFIAGKHSNISNNYSSFFSSTDDFYTNLPSFQRGVGGISMANFLTKNFNCMIEETSNSDFSERQENDPRIPRLKFKQGYSRIWRRARVGIKEYFQIKFQYQHRLTRFLPQFYKLNQISLIKSTELKLENLLIFSYLLPDLITCQEFLNSGLVFLNGRLVLSGKIYTVRNDLIQILISMKYYILFKWFSNWETSKKIRLNRLLYISRLETKRTFRKKLPDWVLRKISFPYDIPKYLEVDYLTLSAFILYEPYLLNDFTHMFQKFSRSPIYNVYNWKYLT